MSFAWKIRLSLTAAALLPLLAVLAVFYFYTRDSAEMQSRRSAQLSVNRFEQFQKSLENELESRVEQLVNSESFQRTRERLASGRYRQIQLDPRLYGLDFLELTNSFGKVVYSYHRPGLLGENLKMQLETITRTVEYDIDGAHAAYEITQAVGDDFYIYTGKYLDRTFIQRIRELMNAEITLLIEPDTQVVFASMTPGQLYSQPDGYRVLLDGSAEAGFYLTADIPANVTNPYPGNMLAIMLPVIAASVLIALAFGFYITSRARREIENLVSATQKVASGDFTTPVMAYQEGEFAQLADAFTDMTMKLRKIQKELATVEKIAAWETLGRKVAHEIKNPLSPIEISIDDLRRSYHEKLPDYDKILDETTATIKTEIRRTIQILEQFVSFARMKNPEIKKVKTKDFMEEIKGLYRPQVEANRFRVDAQSKNGYLKIDPDLFKQVLINLIKNGFESTENAEVTLRIEETSGNTIISVEDTGPGFSESRLEESFQPYESTKAGGSGLGLVISHRIVHDHGGSMELYNNERGGGGVRITLPI